MKERISATKQLCYLWEMNEWISKTTQLKNFITYDKCMNELMKPMNNYTSNWKILHNKYQTFLKYFIL